MNNALDQISILSSVSDESSRALIQGIERLNGLIEQQTLLQIVDRLDKTNAHSLELNISAARNLAGTGDERLAIEKAYFSNPVSPISPGVKLLDDFTLEQANILLTDTILPHAVSKVHDAKDISSLINLYELGVKYKVENPEKLANNLVAHMPNDLPYAWIYQLLTHPSKLTGSFIDGIASNLILNTPKGVTYWSYVNTAVESSLDTFSEEEVTEYLPNLLLHYQKLLEGGAQLTNWLNSDELYIDAKSSQSPDRAIIETLKMCSHAAEILLDIEHNIDKSLRHFLNRSVQGIFNSLSTIVSGFTFTKQKMRGAGLVDSVKNWEFLVPNLISEETYHLFLERAERSIGN